MKINQVIDNGRDTAKRPIEEHANEMKLLSEQASRKKSSDGGRSTCFTRNKPLFTINSRANLESQERTNPLPASVSFLFSFGIKMRKVIIFFSQPLHHVS